MGLELGSSTQQDSNIGSNPIHLFYFPVSGQRVVKKDRIVAVMMMMMMALPVVMGRPPPTRVSCTHRIRAEKKKSNKNKKKAVTTPVGRRRETGVGGFGGEEMTWRCASGCGACCKLDKGPNYPSPREIFSDDPNLAQLVERMIGPDGWCTHYDHSTRTCSIYAERPFFCRVEPDVFMKLYGIEGKSINSEACRACRDTIKSVYGPQSQELKNFNSTG